ncbi:beta-galactosidase [Arsenicicoccus piscis]|uniref:Hydrolase n=1 Tax=Arsenicicoccus piscis TaxID=673954 RepID=A0ABQ6HJA6_9MICO|nr:sugar-binding domain-containing protein [Arsenicicoccus piscis]MCH8627762.1 beta-galactosidase [Arsenicicoccus piscis]GMA18277.1 hydrolase [Arsenicicoccus piscis]
MPRPEHPRPQLTRPTWRSLNGRWDFEIDSGGSGFERGLTTAPLSSSILVPFCPESEASGVGNRDFMETVWYRRVVNIPADWAGTRVLLHLGAVDHDATVWANGVEMGRHRGGFTPFTVDLTDQVIPGADVLVVVRAEDSRTAVQARGKQSRAYAPSGCFYPRTTGIWQSVWLESVPTVHVRRLRITPSVASSSFTVEAVLSENPSGTRLVAELTRDAGHGDGGGADDTVVATATIAADLDLAPAVHLQVPADELRLWEPGSPHLYGLTVRLEDPSGTLLDEVTSYAGLRSISLSGKEIRINGRKVFQRLVLDQGYYPDTLMTAPSDAALVEDIRLALDAGFNGARLHEKVFEERFLFHADRLGYLVWGEFGDWGATVAPEGSVYDQDEPPALQRPTASFVTQWTEVLARDYNHPSIIGWCPLNETAQELTSELTTLDEVTRALFQATKIADPTRPVIDASGWSHRVPETDVYDAHSYSQDPLRFRVLMAGLAEGDPLVDLPGRQWSVPYAGQPYFVSEYGGIWWDPNPPTGDADGEDRSASWGYGQRVRSEEEFHQRFEGLTRVLLENPLMFGYCYTQLTDVFQEQNGIYRFDRTRKLDVDRVRAVQARPAAYESD